MAKTDGVLLNLIGQRIDDDPVPILYIGPTKSNIEKVIEPRLMKMFRSALSLWGKLAKGKKSSKTYKNIAGVSVRFAWAGSATELASEPAGLVLVDERDRMSDDVGGEGDPVELGDARHSTYPDGLTVVTSTPTDGTVEAKLDPETGLEHWEVSDDVKSASWKIWQESTRHEWAWPCPECNEYFIARFKLLTWPEGCTPKRALKEAKIACPHCGCLIGEESKSEMNAKGVPVAPGQKVLPDGTVQGDDPDADTYGLWVSGLCSPWRSFGQRASAFLKAVRSGEPTRIQTVINTGFGELFRVAGDAPEWEQVALHKLPYTSEEVPDGIEFIVMGVDVQQDRLVYGVRGFNREGFESWRLDAGELWGDTNKQDVWDELSEFSDQDYNGFVIERCFVDSGYRADRVYDFCRKHKGWAFPTKGHDQAEKPIRVSKIDVTERGRIIKKGLQLWHIDTDHFKSWVHSRVELDPGDPNGWHLPEDTTDDYCKQIVAEAKVVKPSGKTVWVRLKKDNHFLDVEVLNIACARSLHKKTKKASIKKNTDVTEAIENTKKKVVKKQPKVRRSNYLSR